MANNCTDSGDKKSAVASTPLGTITAPPRAAACRAAIAAANRPSATPMPNPPTAASAGQMTGPADRPADLPAARPPALPSVSDLPPVSPPRESSVTKLDPVSATTLETTLVARVVMRSAIAASPPKYRDGPLARNDSIPGSVISTLGISAAMCVTTFSNRRASPSGSLATIRTCGQHACACRRRWPTAMPSRAAANEWAITRLPCNTTTGSSAAAWAATTAQFGHHNTPSRGINSPSQFAISICILDSPLGKRAPISVAATQPLVSGSHIEARRGRGMRLPPTSTSTRRPDATPCPAPRPTH